MNAHQLLEVQQYPVPHELRKMIIQRIPIDLKSVIVSPFALIDKRGVVFPSERCMQPGPAAMTGSESTGGDRRISAQPYDQVTQLGGRFEVATRSLGESPLQKAVARTIGTGREAALPRLAHGEQLADGCDREAMIHE